MSSVTRVFILQKIRSIAVLKCLGARSRQIIAVYLLQVLALGLAGSLLGVAIARAAIAAIPLALGPQSTSILAEAHYTVTWSAAAQGIGIGVLVSLLFSIVPLLQVRYVKPSLLLRDETVARARDWSRIGAIVARVARARGADGLAGGVAARRPGRLRRLRRAGARAAGRRAACWSRWSRRSRGRGRSRSGTPCCTCRGPGNQTRVILLAVGLGAFFIVGVRSLQASLLREFSVQVSADAPDMFLIDVQRDQVDGRAGVSGGSGARGRRRRG